MKKHDFGKPLCRLIMAVAIMMLSLQAMAYDFPFTHQGRTLYYNITSGNRVAVTYYSYNSSSNNYVSGDVVIPSTVTYNGTTYSVTSIGSSAFYGCSGLTSLTIPNNVTAIESEAFSGCSGLITLNFNAINCQDFEAYYYNGDYYFPFSGTSLTTVNIGDSVQRIPAYFVRGCSGLTSVTIPNSVTSIGGSAFWGCSRLTSITIPNSVTSIEGGAFGVCSGLTSVTIPNSVTSIGRNAFYGCSGLTTLNFNAINCQDFEAYYDYNNDYYYYPFSGTSLTTVNIGDSVQRIPANFVRDCSGLTSVTIPNNVTSIGDTAFSGCSGLTSVILPNSLTSIGGSAFSYCRGLTSVTIPNGVTSIGGFAFSDCSGLTSINVSSGNTHYSSIDGVLYNYVQDTLIQCPGAKTSITIPTGVTSIRNSAFYGCSGLTTLNFNAINCQDFQSYYGNYPFSGTSLTTVNIGDSVRRIPAYFVISCSSLTSVTIPNSVTYIGNSAFWGCSGLTSVTIPTGVTSIGGSAFGGCRGLTSVTIPNSVTSIGRNAFYGCSGLTSVTIPNSVTSIGVRAFYGCSGLTSVTIPTGVTSIGGSAFSYCRGLTSVTIPNSVTSIGESAFYNCSGLTSVIIGNSVTSIGGSAFSGCSSLVSVVIGDGITNIGRNLFGDCPYLTYLTIGRSVESIENGAFLNCSLLSQITSWASVPPEIGGIDAFPHPNNCTVTVPCGSLGAYTEQTNRWNLLFNGRISEGLSFGLSVSANDEAYGRVEVENHSCESKTLTAIANNGYVFTGWNDGNTENPRTVTVTSDTAFVAIFTETETAPTITLTVNDATMGSATYTLDGNTAVLTATPNEGYRFLTWNDGNMENPRTVTLTSDTAFTAIFTETETTPTITVTVNDATMGSATYTMDGNTAVLTATANEGYSFLTWSDGNTENPRTVTVTSDTAFTAIFTETETTPTITVTVNDATMGSATYTMDGNTAVLTATANEGYSFVIWNDGNTENPRTVTVTSDTAFVAIFTETETTPTITVTVNDATMGSATYTMDGNTAVLTATPNEGYRFLTWNDGNTENPRTVTITSDTTFMAIFSPASSLQEVNAREFALYPNPAKSFVNLEFEALKENTLLQILDINGRRVRTLDLKAGQETLRIDLGDLPKGVYTIMIGNVTKKLIVE